MKKNYLLILLLMACTCLNGQVLQWAKQFGGTNNEYGRSIALDAAGNVYITGLFEGMVDFNPGAAIFNLTAAGNTDIFVSKLDAAGNFLWAKQLGGTGNDEGRFIVVDASGNVYTTGYFAGTADFDPGAAIFNLTALGNADIFVSKLDATGNFVYAKRMGGTGADAGQSIDLDAAGNVYTTGYFAATADFDPGAAIFNLTSAGFNDIFISKLDAAGNFVYAKQMGSTTVDEGYCITVDASGVVYTTGYFEGTADFDPSAATFNLTSAGGFDIFVSKLDATGNFVYAKRMGGTGDDEAFSIVVDAAGNVHTTGKFNGTADFDPSAATFNLTSAGYDDIFVSKLDAAGDFVWAKRMGGTGDDVTSSLALDASGNFYTTGYFEETVDFDPSAATFNLTSTGDLEIFVSKLDAAGNFVWAIQLGGIEGDVAFSIALDASGNVYSTGGFGGTADFDPGTGTFNLTASGLLDAFVHKVSPAIVDPPPTVTINQAVAQADPTGASPINFTVVFNETVTGFATGDITLAGTAGATTATVTGSGTTYNVAVSGMIANGTVIATIAAGVAIDAGSNPNAASTSTDNTVTYTGFTIINYYSKSSGNLTSTATWGTNTNGTGTVPPNFTNAFQNFYVTNRTSATLDANWTVSGALSKVITGNGSSASTLIIPSSAALTGIVDVSDLATLRLENATVPTLGIVEDGSTINFAQSTNYEIPAGGTYHNLTVTGGTKTIASGGTIVTGNIVLDGVNFTGSGVSIAVIDLTGNFTLQNGATLGVTGIRPGLVMNGSGTQTLSGGDFRLNYLETPDNPSTTLDIVLNSANLILSGGGLGLQQATHKLSLNGNTLTIEGSASLGDGTGSITGSNTSNITINKSSGSPVGILKMTTGAQTLRNLSLYDASSGGPLELGSPLSITNNLNFLVSGRIITTTTNLLTVQLGATITGGGPNTYIEGPLARVTNAVGDYLFPIGELGSSDGRFIVVKIETPGNTSTFRAQYFETGVNTNGPSCDFNVTGTYGVNGYKINEHYNISRTSGTSPAKITFDFDGSNLNNSDWSNNVAPGTSDGVVMAHYNTTFSCWEVASSQILLYPPSGNITTDLLTSFSPFTFGYIGVSSLPVKFGNVRAYQQGNGIKIDWSNLTESSVVDYKVERSANGRDFTSLSALTAIKNDGSRADYSFVDGAPVNGVNYYRIQSLELDGKKLYSVIVKVDIKGTKGVITLYPNPVTDGQMVLQTPDLKRGSYNLTVVNAVGQQVYSKALSHAGGFVTQSIQLPASLKPGIYNIQMMGDGVKLTKTFLVQ